VLTSGDLNIEAAIVLRAPGTPRPAFASENPLETKPLVEEGAADMISRLSLSAGQQISAFGRRSSHFQESYGRKLTDRCGQAVRVHQGKNSTQVRIATKYQVRLLLAQLIPSEAPGPRASEAALRPALLGGSLAWRLV
jgi:hypothetical protein